MSIDTNDAEVASKTNSKIVAEETRLISGRPIITDELADVIRKAVKQYRRVVGNVIIWMNHAKKGKGAELTAFEQRLYETVQSRLPPKQRTPYKERTEEEWQMLETWMQMLPLLKSRDAKSFFYKATYPTDKRSRTTGKLMIDSLPKIIRPRKVNTSQEESQSKLADDIYALILKFNETNYYPLWYISYYIDSFFEHHDWRRSVQAKVFEQLASTRELLAIWRADKNTLLQRRFEFCKKYLFSDQKISAAFGQELSSLSEIEKLTKLLSLDAKKKSLFDGIIKEEVRLRGVEGVSPKVRKEKMIPEMGKLLSAVGYKEAPVKKKAKKKETAENTEAQDVSVAEQAYDLFVTGFPTPKRGVDIKRLDSYGFEFQPTGPDPRCIKPSPTLSQNFGWKFTKFKPHQSSQKVVISPSVIGQDGVVKEAETITVKACQEVEMVLPVEGEDGVWGSRKFTFPIGLDQRTQHVGIDKEGKLYITYTTKTYTTKTYGDSIEHPLLRKYPFAFGGMTLFAEEGEPVYVGNATKTSRTPYDIELLAEDQNGKKFFRHNRPSRLLYDKGQNVAVHTMPHNIVKYEIAKNGSGVGSFGGIKSPQAGCIGSIVLCPHNEQHIAAIIAVMKFYEGEYTEVRTIPIYNCELGYRETSNNNPIQREAKRDEELFQKQIAAGFRNHETFMLKKGVGEHGMLDRLRNKQKFAKRNLVFTIANKATELFRLLGVEAIVVEHGSRYLPSLKMGKKDGNKSTVAEHLSRFGSKRYFSSAQKMLTRQLEAKLPCQVLQRSANYWMSPLDGGALVGYGKFAEWRTDPNGMKHFWYRYETGCYFEHAISIETGQRWPVLEEAIAIGLCLKLLTGGKDWKYLSRSEKDAAQAKALELLGVT